MAYDPPPMQREPAYPVPRPAVVGWFYVYAGVMMLVYIACVIGGVAMATLGVDQAPAPDDRVAMMFFGVILVATGAVFALLFALPYFLPRKKWVWVYDLVLICIGLTSICTMVVCIPLLLFWIKDENKAYFNMRRAPSP